MNRVYEFLKAAETYYLATVTYFYGHFLSSIATPPNSIFRCKRVLTGTAIIF